MSGLHSYSDKGCLGSRGHTHTHTLDLSKEVEKVTHTYCTCTQYCTVL